MDSQVSVIHFVPKEGAQPCGHLLEQSPKALSAMDLQDVPKHRAGLTLVMDILPYTVHKSSIYESGRTIP